MTRKEQREKRRIEIITAALDLFIHKGVSSTKIQDIANSVGMSVGLLFHYFESKEKLYEEIIKIGTTGTQSFLSDYKAEPIVFFQTMAEQFLHNLKNEPFFFKLFVFMKQAQYNTAAPDAVKDMLNEAFGESDNDLTKILTKKIKQGQKDGSIKKGDPQALAVAFWKSLTGIAEHLALTPNCPVPDSDWIVDILRK